MKLLLIAHAFAAVAMTGVIWFVQVVHYPLFARVGSDSFPRYHRAHTNRTGYVVIPLMLLEAGAATAITLLPATGVPRAQAWTGMVLLIVVWVSTFLVQVPLHRRLSSGLDPSVVRRLVRTNWIRTIAWTARGSLALVWLG